MPDFKPGQTVQLNDGRKAIVRFAGQTSFQVGEWIGVELEEKTGKNDGSVQGERYFDCPMGYGMFVKPMMAKIIAQPAPAPVARPSTVKKPIRPTSFNPGAAKGSVADPALSKRRSLNAPSPSPVPKTRPPSIGGISGITRSPAKSPTKPLSAASSATASRTGTPSNAPRVPSTGGTKPRTSLGVSAQRASMPPPAVPASRTNRQSSISSVAPKATISHTRSASARVPSTGLQRLDATRQVSAGSRPGTGKSTPARAESPVKSDNEILSPQPKSPLTERTLTLEKLASAEEPPKPAPPPAIVQAVAASLPADVPLPRSVSGSTAGLASRPVSMSVSNKEVEDLKAKLKVLERKRLEDRDKLKLLEKVQGERDKYEGIIQKLQQKYQPQQEELTQLRKQLKEAESKFESVENMQADHDTMLELATLDREMAEETAEVLKEELEALKQKAEELELENDVLREENSEFSNGMSAEDRASTGWLQMERTNERLREALIRLRDITQSQEADLKDHITSLEEDVKDLSTVKADHSKVKEKLQSSEAAVEDLRQQLETALGAEDMIEELTEKNMSLSEQMDELRAAIEDLESLKEINDELEINHVQNEKELQEELDFRDSVITEQARRAAQAEESAEDMEYTLSRFRELVTNLQTDLDDMRASQAMTEGESEKLNDRSRAMMDLNMKLQLSAAKAQVKTIDLEMRRLEAQEAEQHLEILKLFLPDTYQEEQDSVLALLRFRRLAFKANILHGFIKDRLNGQPHPGHEDDVFAGCDAVDKLVWVSNICERFVNDISHCSMEQFSKYQHALLELEPVERALNGWIDGLRRDELKEKTCADDLQRTVALMSHLAEVHLPDTVPGLADELCMSAVMIQNHLDSAAISLATTKALVDRSITKEDADDEVVHQFNKTFETVVTQTRGAKVIAGKAVRAVEELKTRSLALLPQHKSLFIETETLTESIASLARKIGNNLHAFLTQDEGRTEPYTYADVQDKIQQAVLEATSSIESDMFSAYLAKLRTAHADITNLVNISSDLDQTQEFDVSPAPWKLRSQELKTLKAVPVDAEEELRKVKEEYSEARRTITQRDEHISTAVLKIETLESRMRDAQANIEKIDSLNAQLTSAATQVSSLKEDIEKQDRELKTLENERDKWKKVASDSRAFADGADAAGNKAGKERAVATAREMDVLKKDIESLQTAVRFLREDNRRARLSEQNKHDWLSEPLKRPAGVVEQRKNLVVAEGKDVLGELVKMAGSSSLFDLASLPTDRLAWKPARTTPQFHAAKQAEDYASWKSWQSSVVRKSEALRSTSANIQKRKPGPTIAKLQIQLPDKVGRGGHVQVVGSREWEALQSSRLAAAM